MKHINVLRDAAGHTVSDIRDISLLMLMTPPTHASVMDDIRPCPAGHYKFVPWRL